jgi:OmcA/MtrC family decaheme c-type cytochrome
MKFADSPQKHKPIGALFRYAAATVLAATLAACGGTSGDTGPAGAAGAPGAPGKDGTNGVNTVAQVIVRSNERASTTEAAVNWKKLEPQITVTKATVVDKPVIEFTVKDPDGNAIVGLGNKTQATTAVVHGYANVAFTIAKLVPGTNNQPSKWVSYLVTSPATVAQKTAVAATDACNNTATTAATWCGGKPTSDNSGALEDLGAGKYRYTFYRDVSQVKAIVASLPDTANGLKKKSELGDLTFDPKLTHRVGVWVGGTAPGTGNNIVDPNSPTPLAPIASSLAPVSVSMVNAGNAFLDFRPDGGAVTETRQIVKKDSCTDCHHAATLAHNGRNDPDYCVTCHTDQRRYSGNAEATTVAGSNGMTFTGSTLVVDGIAVGDFPSFIHKTHMGTHLTKKGYNYGGLLFNEVTYPQDQRNCIKCHDGSATAVNKTKDGDNWKKVPSPMVCGACHDGINYANGTGTTTAGATTGHGGWALKGAESGDPTKCATCHDSASIAFVHTPVTPANKLNALDVPTSAGGNTNTNAAAIASNTSNRPAGAIVVTYDIKSVSVSAGKPVMVFRMLQDGVAVPFNIKAAGVDEIWNNFMGAPSVYFVFAVPQDVSTTAPADFNASASSYLRSLWNGTATGTSAGTLTGPDSAGYYTATLTGVTIPASAKMLTGGLGYSYNVISALPLTQTNLPKYPVVAAKAATGLTAGMPNKTGGLIVVSPDVQKVATGYAGRRAIVSDALCSKCHQELGVFTEETFHGGQRNDGTTCSWCHTPNRTSSGWTADSTNFVHAIHASKKRKADGAANYTWHAASTTEGYWTITYPGTLDKCEACHLPGTYDFAASASASAAANKPYRTVATGTGLNKASMTALAAFAVSPFVPGDATNYGAGFSFNAATGATTEAASTTLVISPITAVCVSCHESKVAKAHMTGDDAGGSFYLPRATALARQETCLLCHGSGRIADIKVMHAK